MSTLTPGIVDEWISEIERHPRVSAQWRSMLASFGASVILPEDGTTIGETQRQEMRDALSERLTREIDQLRNPGDTALADELTARLAKLRDRAKAAPLPSPRLGGIFANAAGTSLTMGNLSEGFSSKIVLKCPTCGAPQLESCKFRCPYCGGQLLKGTG